MTTHEYENDLAALRSSIGKTILGKDDVIEQIIICLISQGHVLIEDVPGVGKTTLAVALARALDGSFQRIQFTSDLLPSDVLGVPVYNSQSGNFDFKPGPIFANIVLADEINRTTPKTQSALLEAMQDGCVTMERTTHRLPQPFMVIATQNPIEFHGTYPLPESQLDRFLMRLTMGYPESKEELRILQTHKYVESQQGEAKVCSGARMAQIQQAVDRVKVEGSIAEYLLQIVQQTRQTRQLELGASPRGALALHRAAQSRALVHGRMFVTPDDIKASVLPVLAHRIIVSGRRTTTSTTHDYRATAEVVLNEILNSIEVPV